MMSKQKTWFLKRRSRLYIGSNEMKSSLSKFKGSIFAIIFGLIIACFVVIGSGKNAFTYFQLLLVYTFTSWPANNWDNTLVWWAVYIIAGLALVVSFRSGMFNIGVAGQMLAAGAVVIAIGIRYDLSQPVAIIFALTAGVLAAMLVALITALLKVYFNVHEVVTSILLNWTIWYLIKWLFERSNDLFDSTYGTTANIHDNMSMSIGGYNCILPLLLAGFLVILIWFLLKKTTLGYKVRTVGLNPFAAAYSGINRKYYCVTSFVISGALAGVMAVIYYIAENPSISFLNDDLPTIGFDSIAVALVGQINPIGVVGAGFLWGLIKSGGSIGTVLELPTATGDIIFGVIIYSAACAVLLSRLQPIKFLIRYFNIAFDKNKRKVSNRHIANMYYHFINVFKIKKEYGKKIHELRLEVNKRKVIEINKLKQDSQQLISQKLKDKSDVEMKIKALKQQYEQEIINLSSPKIKVQIQEVKKKYKADSIVLLKEKNKICSLIKEMKQNLKKNINQINTTIDPQLQELINTRIDKVGVSWAQVLQENKALKHYMYKQYSAIWKKGKIGNWNSVQQQKKVIYGESLNTYINEKMNYETVIYNYKQELTRELLLLKKQKSILDKSRIKDLKQKFKIEEKQLKQEFSSELLLLRKQESNNADKQLKQELILLKKQKIMLYKSQIKNLKQKTNAERKQLQEKIVPINNSINVLTLQFTKKVIHEKQTFIKKFSDLLKNEQKLIMQIKPQIMVGGKNDGRT